MVSAEDILDIAKAIAGDLERYGRHDGACSRLSAIACDCGFSQSLRVALKFCEEFNA